MTAGRQYARLRMDIWRDDDWRELSADAQWLYELLISQPNITTAGVLPLQITKWARYAADMTVERVTAAVELLLERRYVVLDEDTEEILVRTFLRHDAVSQGTPKVMLSALRAATAVQSQCLRAVLLDEIQRIDRDWPENQRQLIKALQESLSKAFRKPIESLSKGLVEVEVSSTEVGSNTNFTTTGLRKSGTSPARAGEDHPVDSMGRPTMSLTVLAGGADKPPAPPPPDRRIPGEVIAIVPASLHPDTRERLQAEVAKAFNRDGDIARAERAMDRWLRRAADGEDIEPWKYRQCYSAVVAEETITPQQRRNGRTPTTTERRIADALSLKSNPTKKELT